MGLSTTMVFDTATGMLPPTAGQVTSYKAQMDGILGTHANPVCFQYFNQKPGKTLADQDPALAAAFSAVRTKKYPAGIDITVDRDNGNCASRGFLTQIASPIVNGNAVYLLLLLHLNGASDH